MSVPLEMVDKKGCPDLCAWRGKQVDKKYSPNFSACRGKLFIHSAPYRNNIRYKLLDMLIGKLDMDFLFRTSHTFPHRTTRKTCHNCHLKSCSACEIPHIVNNL